MRWRGYGCDAVRRSGFRSECGSWSQN
jgi:hypothetical protein